MIELRARTRIPALLAGVVFAAGVPEGSARAQTPGFAVDSVESAEGYYQLRWQADVAVRLLESGTPDFADARTLYTGADTARVVSGKPDGRWYYRLEDAESGAGIGATLTVTVAHHSLGRAVAFFAIGAIVFAATLGLIVVGGRKASV